MSTHLSEHMFAAQGPLPDPPPQGRAPDSIAELEVLEAFRHGEGLTGGLLSRPFADSLLQFGPLADLALVFPQGCDLEVDGLTDINPDIGLVRAGQVDLFDFVWLEPFVEQLGEHQARVGARNDGVERRLARGAMVGMVDVALAAPASRRVGRHDNVGLGATNPAG